MLTLAMQSKAKSVTDYLKALPDDRRAALNAVREVVNANVDANVEEGMSYGMIGWYIPHRIYPQGYHCDPKQPLPYAGLASQKNYISLYLMWTYGDSEAETWLREQWQKAGLKLDMGKCCIRFKSIDDVPLDIVAKAVQRMPAKKFLAYYESMLDSRTGKPKSQRESVAIAKPKAKTKPKAVAKPKAAAAKSGGTKKPAAKKA
jgi:hypothetical protein